MKYIISTTVLFLLFTTLPALAQTDEEIISTEELREFDDQLERGAVRTFRSRRVKGSPYLGNDWTKGYVMLNNKARTENLLLRFDVEKNLVLFSRDDKIYALNSGKIAGFVLDTYPNKLVFKNGFRSADNDINSKTLLRIIQEGDTKFVAYHTAKLQEDLPTYGMASQVDEFIKDVKYFIVTSDGTFHDVKLKRRHILRALEDKENELREFADANNLDYGEENDVARIVGHYNNLKSRSSSQ